MKVLLFKFLFLFFTAKVYAQSVSARFVNKVGQPLDSLIINGELIQHLGINDTSQYLHYKAISFKGKVPLLTGKCKINGEWIASEYMGAYIHKILTSITKGSFDFIVLSGFVNNKFGEGKVLALFFQ